ncbi:MAG TPA: bifunctional riboflavin kinase/FAD synthetase [Candidatus Acidoferrales bacterium]|nr:bifunctional riboflavin kinase/FAD synthetase [Candidatus Acidoferrales bacterium]
MTLARVHSAEEWIARFGESRSPSVVTIGNFDGMHLGHQEIVRRLIAQARQTGCMAAVLTLYPHPARLLRPGDAPSLLATLDQRLAAFDAAGIDAVLVLRFDAELAKVEPRDFARRYLAETMRARKVLVGGNFRFGYRQQGDVKALEEFGRQWGFELEVVQPLAIDETVVSSTAIRGALREGRVEDAARMLGKPFTLEGEIQTGTGQGRKLVVPTLNLKTEQETLPKLGVYATETAAGGGVYRSVTNVGKRPTFNGAGVTIESHLFNFNENWTSGRMEVRFLRRLRDEKTFNGPGALREQVLGDIEEAKAFFAR